MAAVESLQMLDDYLGELDRTQPYPADGVEGPRGRAGSPKKTALPDGWLDSQELSSGESCTLEAAELDTSGG
jgi:hypothetical protein